MTSVILILTVGLILLSISQVATVYIFLTYLGIAPKIISKVKRVKKEDANDFGESKYVDISEIPSQEALQSFGKK
jgi:hypothetical protein